MAIKSKYLQFSFLPYISLENELKIGDILFWSFYKKKDEYIKEGSIRNQIQRFLKQYVTPYQPKESLREITIVSYKSPDNFRSLTIEQAQEMGNAVTILCFCTLIKNADWRAFSSDDFQLMSQNFIPGSDEIAPFSGSWIQRKIGGLKIDEVLFTTPFYISIGWNINFYEKLLRALEKLQQNKKNNADFYRRVITALEWVAHSYTNVDNFNFFSRIIMMSTAFEILLGGFRDRFEFMEKIKKLTCKNSEPKEVREIFYKGKKVSKNTSLKEWWAYEFYELRSRIVHGKELKSDNTINKKGKNHFKIAILFFEECLKKILSEKGYYDYDFGDKIIWAGIYDWI